MASANQTLSQDALNECDREPIHIPGSIQPHGLFLALDPASLRITHVSENFETHYGLNVDALLGSPLVELIDPGSKERLADILDGADRKRANPMRVPMIIGSKPIVFDGVAHPSGRSLILELEDPRSPAEAAQPTSLSTDSYFQLIQASLLRATDLHDVKSVAELMTSEIKRFTGFDRVMVYRFAPNFDGEVFAESKEAELEPFLGLRYPATDIPKQARELYKRNWLRLLHDVHAEPTRIRSSQPVDGPLDLSHSVLRSISPVHIQYLKNMGVAATLTISLLDGGELWGMIACHHYKGPKYIPYAMRSACALYGVVMSGALVATERRASLSHEVRTRGVLNDLVRRTSVSSEVFESLHEHLNELIEHIGGDGGAIVNGDCIKTAGTTPAVDRIRDLITQCESKTTNGVYVTDSAVSELDISPDEHAHCAGIVVINMPPRWSMLFFKKSADQIIRWGGNPQRSEAPKTKLTPRASFDEWIETVKDRSLPWSDFTPIMATEIRVSLSALVFERSRELKAVNDALQERNAEVEQFVYTVSHDLKSPLVTCSGFVGMLTDDIKAEDSEGVADSLGRIQRSINHMSDLIDELLEYTRLGKHKDQPKLIDMKALIAQIEEDFRIRFEACDSSLKVLGEPRDIIGQRLDVMRCFENLLSNALKYCCEEEGDTIELRCSATKGRAVFAIHDRGPGIDQRYHQKIFALFSRVDKRKKGTGVGLASVAKIMNQHHGSITVDSTPGEGSIFTLQFPLPE